MKKASIAITAALVLALAINVFSSNETASYTPSVAELDRCVPEHSGVLSLAVQKVNHIVAPECK